MLAAVWLRDGLRARALGEGSDAELGCGVGDEGDGFFVLGGRDRTGWNGVGGTIDGSP